MKQVKNKQHNKNRKNRKEKLKVDMSPLNKKKIEEIVGKNLDDSLDENLVFSKCLEKIKKIFLKNELLDEDFIELNTIAEGVAIFFDNISVSKLREIYDHIVKIESVSEVYSTGAKVVYLEAKEKGNSFAPLREFFDIICFTFNKMDEDQKDSKLKLLKNFFEMVVAYHRKHANDKS